MAKNYKNPLSNHQRSDPLNFSAAPLNLQSSYSDKYQVHGSRVLQFSNSVETLLRVASKKEQVAASESTSF